MVWAPTGSAVVLKAAEVPDSEALPRSSRVVVSKKSTRPLGIPAPGAFDRHGAP